MRDGKIHVQCLNTGLVPTGVNLGGFVPVCVMAAPDGSFGYEGHIIVPASSSVNSLKDLKDKSIALTSTHSLSSFKAPIVLLWDENKMYPGRDYDFVQTGSQERSRFVVVSYKDSWEPVRKIDLSMNQLVEQKP